MINRLFKLYSQGMCVAGCAAMSFLTLGYLADDIHKIEKKKIINDYEKQINKLKLENSMIK
jgi:hypothetical protein